MNSRERVRLSLSHKEPDAVPVDFGGCGQTGINASTLYQLRKYYGLPEKDIEIIEPYQMLGAVDEDLRKKLGVDILPLWNPTNLMGTSMHHSKPWKMPDGTPVLMSDNFEYDETPKGTFVYPQGDRTAPCSLHMPAGGSFFDNINRSEFDEDDLKPLEDFGEQYTVVPDETCVYWERESKRLYEETEYSLIGVLGGMGLGDAAEVPGPFLKHPKGIRDMENWLMAHVLYPEYIEEIFELQTNTELKNLERYKQAVGDRIDSIWLSGTDFGTQNGLFLSKDIFMKLYFPYYKKVNDWIHANTNWKTFYHSCGAVRELIPTFIEMGVDIINPVQCSAKGMEAEELKEEFGSRITFWGGGINTQKTLPYGTEEEVKREVRDRIRIFSKNGGYVFATIHNIVANVPAKNVAAMFDAVREERGI